MDTDDKYLNDEFYVVLAGEKPRREDEPAFSKDDDGNVRFSHTQEAPETHPLNKDVPVDGYVEFYDPERWERGEPHRHGTFYFRDHTEDTYPWSCYPDREKFSTHPVWKWQNPDDDPHEELTLSPSIGLNGDDGLYFHCYVKQGEIEWL